MKLRLLGALVITLVFLYLLLPNIDSRLLLSKLKEIDLFKLAIAFVAMLLANFVKAARFSNMAAHSGSLRQWWHINQTYNLLTTLLPGGGGEVASAYAMKMASNDRESISIAARSLLLGRLMDLLFYSILLLITASLLIDVSEYALLAVGVSLVFTIFAWWALTPTVERWLLTFVERYLIGKLRVFSRFRAQLTELIDISELQRNQGRIRRALIHSSLLVLFAALSVYFTIRSLGLDISLTQGLFCTGLFALFQLIPIQGVAGIGTQAAWWSFVIAAAGYTGAEVLTLGIILHAIFFMFVVVMFVPSGLYLLINRSPR